MKTDWTFWAAAAVIVLIGLMVVPMERYKAKIWAEEFRRANPTATMPGVPQ